MTSSAKTTCLTTETIESTIRFVRGQRIIFDEDLARIYGVSTRQLNQAVKRNAERFPDDFAFQLKREELTNLKSQIVTSSSHGGRRKLPTAFTEHGAIMAANVLNSPRAVQMSVFVVRAFVRLREVLASHKELAERLDELERKFANHDEQIQAVFEALRQLMNPPEPPRRRIGFHVEERRAPYRVRRRL
jgi:hypothetical protein